MDGLLALVILIISIWFGAVLARANRRLDVLERSHETLERLASATAQPQQASAFVSPLPAVSEPSPVVAPLATVAEPLTIAPAPQAAAEPLAPQMQVPHEPAATELEPVPSAGVAGYAPRLASDPSIVQRQEQKTDLERVIAGSWLNRIGIVALLIATAFFLKLAIDNNWIGPMARITIGLLAGVGLLGFSQLLFRKGYGYFSEGMVALGGGVLYVSLFASWELYHLFPVPLAFAGMVLVTGCVLGISLARNSERLAFLAMIGGFVTPLLLNTGTDNEVGLFSYLALLNAGLLWVAQARDWRSLPIAFIFTLAYADGWYLLYYAPQKLALTAFFAMLFYVEFSVLPVRSARRSGVLPTEHMALVLLNTTWFTLAATDMLYGHHRFMLAALMLVLSLAHFTVARTAASAQPPIARAVYDALSCTFLAIAIGAGLHGPWIALGWSVEGAALVLAGLHVRQRALRMEGLVLLGAVVTRLAVVPHETGRFLLNAEFGTFAFVIACIAFAAYRAYRQADRLAPGELKLYSACGVVANVLAVWALSRELWDLNLRAGLLCFELAIFWSVYGAALVLIGNVRRSSLLMAQGIVLIAMAILCETLNYIINPDIASQQTAWMAMLWAFVGAIFVWRGVFWQSRMARAAGLALLVVAPIWALAWGIAGGSLLINARFGTLVFIIACYGIAISCGRSAREQLPVGEAHAYDGLSVGINVLALWALSDEVLSIHSLGAEGVQLMLTLLWTVYAIVLMVLGLRRSSPFVRWQSLTLLGIVIFKVFLVDLSVLPLALRILSFLALGVVLMAVSFFYQRRLQSQRTGKT